MDEERLTCFLWLAAFLFSLGVDGGAGLGEDGRDVGRRVVEGGAGVADGDAYEVEPAPILS